jgi:hypothetical protein
MRESPYPAAVDDLDTPNCPVCLSRMEAVDLATGPEWVCFDCIMA